MQAKKWISRCIQWSGLGLGHEILNGQQLIILTYHRVLPAKQAMKYPLQGMVMTKELFDSQMAYLSKKYAVLIFPEAMKLMEEKKLPKRSVVITFDDGYQDNHTFAYPILKKYNIPATFFLVSGAIDRDIVLWWDEITCIVDHIYKTSRKTEKIDNLPEWFRRIVDSNKREKKSYELSKEIIEYMHLLDLEERKKILLSLRSHRNYDTIKLVNPMMTWEQVRNLCEGEMHIGAHTVTHAFINELNTEKAFHEIEGSINRIAEQINRDVDFFAYPRGRLDDRLKSILKKSGVKVAVSTEHGRNQYDSDMLKLKRIDGGYCSLSGGFDPGVFNTELQGWFQRFRKTAY